MENVEKIADLAMASEVLNVEVCVPGSANKPLTFVHKDMHIINTDKYMDAPKSIDESINVCTIESFISYIEKFGSSPVVFGFMNESGNIFNCTLDYHESSEKPSWGKHSINMQVSNSEQWRKWTANENERLTQRKFAEFIEDNIADIVEPDTASLLQQIRNVSLSSNSHVKSSANDNGDVVAATGHLLLDSGVPQPMTLALKPWKGMNTHMAIKARIYAHINDGEAVRFSYQLLNTEAAIEAKFNEYVEMINSNLSVQVLI